MPVISMKPATIRDVARKAQVSPAAVSRYLNNQLVLPAATVKRIEAAVRDLNYVPNAIARRLSRRSSETIGFVTTDIVYPFFASIASAAEQAASEHGFSLTIFNSRNDPERELQILGRIDDREVDGMLFMTNHVDDGRIRDKINASGRVVLIDEDIPGATAPRLFAESVDGGVLATRHLIEHGHTRIAYLGGPRGLISSDERYEGYAIAMREAGLPLDPEMVFYEPYDTDVARATFPRIWAHPRPPTAIFASGDLLALGILHAARDLGLSVPADVSIVSFDDMPHAALVDPPLTTIRQSNETFGRRGVALLLDLLEGRPTPPEPLRVEVELVVRGSVAAPPRRINTARRPAVVAGFNEQGRHR